MSSDSSDDEDLTKLREAADSQFISDSMFGKNKRKTENEAPIEPLKSLRPCRNDDEQFNHIRVTPEFRNHIAKHLSVKLDQVLQELECKTETNDEYSKRKRRKSCIKLFRDSHHFISLKPEPQPVQIKQKIKINSDDEDAYNYNKCQAVVVNSADILSHKDTKHWSTRSKAPVFHYQQTKTGLILK